MDISRTCQPPIDTNIDCKTTCTSCSPNCGRCRVKHVDADLKLCKYQQPPIPTSYKPCAKYLASTVKLDDQTIYRNSYTPCKGVRNEQIIPPNNLDTGEGKMSKDTVHNTSYQRYKGALPAKIHVPCRGNLQGSGPMQDTTTQKHDYVPKPIELTISCKPPEHALQNDYPFSSQTTNRLSYTPVDTSKAKVKSFRPCTQYKPTPGKMEYKTTQSLSYLPYDPQGPIDKPWALRKPYSEPELQMLGATVYSTSYQPVNGERQKSFKPNSSCIPLSSKMEDGTTYRKSYKICELGKISAYRPENCLGVSDAKMSGDTIHKMAYQRYENAKPASLLRPCTRTVGKDEPMQGITTHKNDYTEKPIEKREPFRPDETLLGTDSPFSDLTTNRLSYKAYDGFKPLQPMKIKGELNLSTGKIEDKTTNNLSYLPWKTRPKEVYPWVPSDQYHEPSPPMAGITIQATSYQLPGTYVACSKDDRDCIPCPQPENKPGQDPCCENCCCQTVNK